MCLFSHHGEARWKTSNLPTGTSIAACGCNYEQKLDSTLFVPKTTAAGPFHPSWVKTFTTPKRLKEERVGSKEEKEGVNVGGKRKTLLHDSVLHPKGKEEEQECLQERQMNDEQTSGVWEAGATCLQVRTTRHHRGRGEELPLPSSWRPVLLLQSMRNEQLQTYCGADTVIMWCANGTPTTSYNFFTYWQYHSFTMFTGAGSFRKLPPLLLFTVISCSCCRTLMPCSCKLCPAA